MDDGRPGLVVLLFADPHLLEGGQRGQDGAANPDRVFALGRGDDLLVRMRKAISALGGNWGFQHGQDVWPWPKLHGPWGQSWLLDAEPEP